jgi:DNA-nicking Smr family endonuclease
MRRARSLTKTDRAIWASYAQMVARLPGVAKPDAPPAPSVSVMAPTTAPHVAATKPTAHRPAPLAIGDSPGGVDRSTWTRFRTGKLPAARTLDLHGRTAQRAHAALEQFLMSCAAEGVRCVEVITGRGSGEAGGVIRREFPFWLNQPHLRHLILGAAHPHAMNPGSVRLLLKRTRVSSPSPAGGRGPG